MHTNSDESLKTSIPEWLDKLQQESWQAEILISGGAFVALSSVGVAVIPLFQYLFYSTHVPGDLIRELSFSIDFVVPTLMLGFFIHLVLRGFWIGLVGMNYVFPAGINKERLAMKGKFKDMFPESLNTSLIIRLDKYCSAIFAIAFVWVFSCISALIFVSLFVLMADNLKRVTNPSLNVVVLLFILIGLITFVDFISAGRIKRSGWFARVYYPVHKIVSWITLSFIYRRLYYTIVSNIRLKYAILIFSIPFLWFVCFTQFSDSSSELSDSFNDLHAGYKNSSNPSFLTIKDKVVVENLLEVELIHIARLEERGFVEWKKRNPGNSETSFDDLNLHNQQQVLTEIYQIQLDGKPVACDWLVTRPRQTAGPLFPKIFLVTVLRIADLSSGPHQISVVIKQEMPDLSLQKNGGVPYAKLGFYFQKPE